ncbi:MAG: hypothetical protein OXI87_14825 [Albidovulum sp.]|nr:hypothetical protein [Albidovulum sp.]MDE0306131.1 hypothetical protein [Albidovulum sp.]MDE0531840.1 hypothetical protein [Albidovulum sp.]
MHTYLRYLAMLPYEEQLYWQSFNEWPKSNISKRAWENDILEKVSAEIDQLYELKRQVQPLDRDPPVWWKKSGEDIVEGFAIKGLRTIITDRKGSFEKEWRALKLLEVALSLSERTEQQAKMVVAPLKNLHNLRNLAKARGDSKGRRQAIAAARWTHGTLRKHFQDLIELMRKSMKEILSDPVGPNPT